MANQTVRDRYVSDGAGTVPQPRLLIMLYERLCLDLQQAETAIDAKDYVVTNDKLCHAQDIITALQTALDVDAWSAGEGLSELYAWIHWQLVEANTKKDAEVVRSCRGMVEDLLEAWRQAYQQLLSGQAPAGTPGAA